MSLTDLGRLGARYAVAPEPDAAPIAELRLSEAKLLAPDGERPLSLIWTDREEHRLTQGTYWLSLDGGMAEPLFLVPIGARRYEAIFN